MANSPARKLNPAAELAAYKTGELKCDAAAELEDRYLRLAAEFDNYRKRTARQYAEIVKNANEELIQDILGVLDDFSHALQSLKINNDDNGNMQSDNVIAGMRMIYDKLLGLLKMRGVQHFGAVDDRFDPQLHDAILQMPSDKEEGLIVEVISPGYTLNDKVIRHARVVVASSK